MEIQTADRFHYSIYLSHRILIYETQVIEVDNTLPPHFYLLC